MPGAANAWHQRLRGVRSGCGLRRFYLRAQRGRSVRENGAVKHALVIGADVLSRTLDPEDRGTIILFGDGAGAVVLGASEAPGILSTHLHADGSYGNLLTLPYKDRQNQDKPAYVTMAGNEVFKVAVTELARIVDETLQANNMDRSELDWLVPHQANLRIISATAKNWAWEWTKWW